MIIQSHRGAGRLAPENTLEAFERAWALGTYPEADLRTTRDGVIVALHDETLGRSFPACPESLHERSVSDLTWAELSAATSTSEGRSSVPRLEDILARMVEDPGRCLYLDVKQVDLACLAALVLKSGMASRVILATPRYDEARTWSSLVRGGHTLYWMGGDEAMVRGRLEELRAAGFQGVTQLQVHIRLRGESLDGPGAFTLPDPLIRELGQELDERGILFQALPWDLHQPEVYQRLLELGVRSFATDYPEAGLQAVIGARDEERGERG